MRDRKKYRLQTETDFAEYIKAKFPENIAANLIRAALATKEGDMRLDFYKAVLHLFKNESFSELTELVQWRTKPVSMETYLFDPFYLGVGDDVFYPGVLDALLELNNGSYTEAVLTGGIGSGKTTISLYSIARQNYILSCYRSPHRTFNLDPATDIYIVFQSIKEDTAEKVDYSRYRRIIEASPYFASEFPYDQKIKTYLKFPHNVIVTPVNSLSTAAIGMDVFSGLVDEINHMSARNIGKNEAGDVDASAKIYNAFMRRRESRFLWGDKLHGLVCIAGSKMYPGQITDKKTEQAREQIKKDGRTNIFVYDKAVWDVAPPSRFPGKKFPIFVGDKSLNPKILEEDQVSNYDEKLITWVPVVFKHQFEDDIFEALREIAGYSQRVKSSFIVNQEPLISCFGKHPSIFLQEIVDLTLTPVQLDPSLVENPQAPRYVHLDLSINTCNTGIAIGHVPGFKSVNTGTEVGGMPYIKIDGMLAIKPPTGGEIPIAKIREILYALTELGLNIEWVSADGFQSRETLQALSRAGYKVGVLSVQKPVTAYMFTKTAFYERRIIAPTHELCLREFRELVWVSNRGMVDHPPNGSKDVCDCLAGVVYGLTMQSDIWESYFDSIGDSEGILPDTIREAMIANRIQKVNSN